MSTFIKTKVRPISSQMKSKYTEGRMVQGTIKQFKKYMIKFWTSSLLVPQAAGEIIGLCAKPKNARQILGLDIYETQLLCRHFQVKLMFELYRKFDADRKPLNTFMNAYFHPNQMATLLAQLERLQKTLKKDLGFVRAVQREEAKFVITRQAEQKRIEAEILHTFAQNKRNKSAQAQEKSQSTSLATPATSSKTKQADRSSSQKSIPKIKKKKQQIAKTKKQHLASTTGQKKQRDLSQIRTKTRRQIRSDTNTMNTDSVKEHQRKNSKDGHVKGENLVSPLLPQIVTGDTPKKVSTIQNSESAVLNVDAVDASTSVDGAKSTRTVIASTDYNDHQPRSSRSQVSWQKATLKTQKTLVESHIKKVENRTNSTTFMDPATIKTSLEQASVPESDIDVFLKEPEIVRDSNAIDTFEKWSEKKYRAVDLTEYIVHPEIGKHAELDLNHFGLGEDETNMLYGYLEDNQAIKAVLLQDNRIGPGCAAYLAKTISQNNVLTKLDLSNNLLGKSVVSLAHALKNTHSLKWLSLRGNRIGKAAKQFADGIKHNRSLRALDLSYNDIDDEGGYCVARAIRDNKKLKEVNLNWNSMGAFAGEALGQVLKFNTSLLSLSVAWNNLCCNGTIGLAEGLAQNSTLQFLDASSNRINYPAVTLFSEALCINRNLQNLQLNNNPLGTCGTHLLFAASECNTSLKHIGLNRVAAPPHTQRISLDLHFFDSFRLSGHYILDLEVRWDHAIAELLRCRVVQSMGQIFRCCFNDELVTIDFKTYVIPLAGHLSFDYLCNEMLQKANLRPGNNTQQPQSVHYTLDLSQSDDRDVYHSLCEQARMQDGENFINETLNGEKFEFDEEAKRDETERLRQGIIEVDFVTTRLAHEARYQFDLRHPQQRAKATKMLERVYLSQKHTNPGAVVTGIENIADNSEAEDKETSTKENGNMQMAEKTSNPMKADTVNNVATSSPSNTTVDSGDQWTNVTIDGKSVNVHEWRVNVDSNYNFKWRDEIDKTSLAESLRETWRVPTKGVLEFDLVTSNPMYIFSDHYKLNLANVRDRQLAESLRVSAALQPGENWWNETLNGYRFDLNEIVGGGGRLPNRGILEFDIVMLAPQRGTMQMKQDHYIFDLEDEQEYECASIMRKRIMKYRLSQEEFWMHVRLNNQIIPASMVWRAMWQIPTKGVLEFDYVSFDSERRDIPRNTFKLLAAALKSVNDREKYYLLQSQSAGADPYHIKVNQIRKLLNLFNKGAVEQRMGLEVLLGMLRHPHHALHLLDAVAERDHHALKYWALHSKWMV